MMTFEQRFDALGKYMNIYIDLLPYTIDPIGQYQNGKGVSKNLYALRKSDLPTFKEYLEPEPEKKGWKNWRREPPLQRTMIIRNGNRIVNTHCGGVFTPNPDDTSWLYYYRYDTWHGCRFNVTPKIFNPRVKVKE